MYFSVQTVPNEAQNYLTTNFRETKNCEQHGYIGLGGKTLYQTNTTDCALNIFQEEKTYTNHIPSETPKIVKPTQSQPRTTFKYRERIPFKDVSNGLVDSPVNDSASNKAADDADVLKQKILDLQSELERLTQRHESEINDLNQQLLRSRFSLQRFKDSDSDIEFYTGFSSYSKFKDFFDFLSPACQKLRYVGSNNGNVQSEQQQKRGKKKIAHS